MEPEGIMPEPVTVMVTARVCAVVMVEEAGLTVTVGVVGFWLPPPPEELPPPPQEETRRAAVRIAAREADFVNRFIRTPGGQDEGMILHFG